MIAAAAAGVVQECTLLTVDDVIIATAVAVAVAVAVSCRTNFMRRNGSASCITETSARLLGGAIPRSTASKTVFKSSVVLCAMLLLWFLASSGRDIPSRSFSASSSLQSNQATFRSRNLNGDWNDDNHCEFPNAHPDPCSYVRTHCAGVASNIDYLQVRYCLLGHVTPVAYILLILWLVYLFYLLGHTADEYFSPCLAKIADVLHLSHNVAGVTFLAFGNGAPDIFSSFAGLTSSDAGIAFGALFGAGVFVTTVVVATVSMAAPSSKLTRRPFVRDVLFYLGSTGFFFSIVLSGHVQTWQAAFCISIYVAYVILVIVSRIIFQRWKHRAAVTVSVEADPDTASVLTEQDLDSDIGSEDRYCSEPEEDSADVLTMLDEVGEVGDKDGGGTDATVTITPNLSSGSLPTEQTPLVINSLTDDSSNLTLPSPFKRFWIRIWHDFKVASEWNEKSRFQKFFFVLVLPTTVVLRACIPVVDVENYSRVWLILYPMASPMFMMLVTSSFQATIRNQFPVWALVLMIGAVLSVVVAISTRNLHGKPPRYFPWLLPAAFILSVAWVYVVANEVVSLLQSFGIMWSITPTLLGLTVLAWGNSIGDLVADTAVARNGFGGMAIGACYGGPMFNLLMGVGIPLLYWTIRYSKPYVFAIESGVIVAMSALCISLLSALVIIPLRKFQLWRVHAVVLYIFYAGFFTLSLLTSFKIVFS